MENRSLKTDDLKIAPARSVKSRDWLVYFLLAVGGITAGVWFTRSGRPVLAIQEEVHDFGLVSGGADMHHTFVIENQGRQPLHIKNIEASCGCIKEAKMLHGDIVPPGKREQLQVTLETPNYAKNVQETITLQTNDSVSPTKRLVLKATVKPVFTLQPAVINFGIVEKSQLPITQKVTVNSSGSRLRGNSMAITSGSEDLHVVSVKTGDKQWTLSVTLPKSSPVGPISSDVTLAPSGMERQSLPVLGQVVGDIYAEPSEIFLRTSDVSKRLTQKIEVKSRKASVERLHLVSLSPSLKDMLRPTTGNSVGQHSLSAVALVPRSTPPDSTIKGHVLLRVDLTGGMVQNLVVPVVIFRAAHTDNKPQ